MKHRSTLLLISPVPWKFPNKQIQLFALELAKKRNIIFIDTFRLNRIGIKLIVLNKKYREQYIQFAKILRNKNTTVIKNPIFLTLNVYIEGQHLTRIDELLFIIQIFLLNLYTTGHIQLFFYAISSYFIEMLKHIPNAVFFYDFYDRAFDISSIQNEKILRNNEQWLFERSSLIFTNTSFHKEYIRSKLTYRTKRNIIVTPIGYKTDQHLLITPKKQRALTVGYAGSLSTRLDYDLITRIVKKHKDIKFVFFGPIYEDMWISPTPKVSPNNFFTELSKLSNVTLIHEEANTKKQSKIIGNFTVGWIPYDLRIPFNQYCIPTKFIEYCAIGLPVISTQIPSLREFSDFCYFFKDPKEFDHSLKTVKAKHDRNQIIKTKRFAKKHQISEKINVVNSAIMTVIQ